VVKWSADGEEYGTGPLRDWNTRGKKNLNVFSHSPVGGYRCTDYYEVRISYVQSLWRSVLQPFLSANQKEWFSVLAP
jgi:hypothetical protein